MLDPARPRRGRPRSFARRLRTTIVWIAAAGFALPLAAHWLIGWLTRIEPPPVKLPLAAAERAYSRVRAGLHEVHLEGSPEAIGAAHGRLLRDAMIAGEEQLWREYARYVPIGLARMAIDDYSRIRYHNLDRGLPDPRRRELAAEALAFQPDPFDSRMPTYQRMLFLHALYDVALSLEHSPLIGCTSFGIGPAKTVDGHVLVARALDFEAAEMFDRDKVAYFVAETGAIPFASIAWPGFVGVVTGMNVEGVVAVVHGGRAGQPSTEGIPVPFSLRQVLERAHSTPEAIEIAKSQRVMVSHILFVADSEGRFAVVERAPNAAPYVRGGAETIAVTNHFEGPLAADPKNIAIRRTTTTLARRVRAEELLSAIEPHSATPARVLSILRDHRCAGDASCALGDRRAIDALVATHGIVADTTDRILWVSAGPALSGKFVRLDLRVLLAPDHDPAADVEPETLPEDPTVGSMRRPNGAPKE